MDGPKDAETCGDKAKKYKWWIGGAAIIVLIAIILGVTLGKKDDNPDVPPTPPKPPTPPSPPDVYNPYTVESSTIFDAQHTLTGILQASNDKLDKLHA